MNYRLLYDLYRYQYITRVYLKNKNLKKIPNLRGVCGHISLADVNFRAESRIVIKTPIFSYCVIM